MSSFAVLIPAYMPDERLTAFALELLVKGLDVLVVDDGSGPDRRKIFDRIEELGIPVVRHESNLGKGGAIKTGIREISKRWPSVSGIITADCDGRYGVEDIEQVSAQIEKHPDTLILGRRRFGGGVSFRSRLGNGAARVMYRFVSGIRLSDTQSGLRGFPPCLFKRLMALEGNRYDYETNMLLRLREWGAAYLEIPVKALYREAGSGRHSRTATDFWLILRQLLSMAATSIVSYSADYFLFWLFGQLFGLPVASRYVFARIASSFLNYKLNSSLIFKSTGIGILFKYYLLSASVMVLGSVGTHFLSDLLGISSMLSKLFVDFPLFFLSYTIQKRYVFREARKSPQKKT